MTPVSRPHHMHRIDCEHFKQFSQIVIIFQIIKEDWFGKGKFASVELLAPFFFVIT